jgi:hypothetical protein
VKNPSRGKIYVAVYVGCPPTLYDIKGVNPYTNPNKKAIFLSIFSFLKKRNIDKLDRKIPKTTININAWCGLKNNLRGM